jgi:hypothetical protein
MSTLRVESSNKCNQTLRSVDLTVKAAAKVLVWVVVLVGNTLTILGGLGFTAFLYGIGRRHCSIPSGQSTLTSLANLDYWLHFFAIIPFVAGSIWLLYRGWTLAAILIALSPLAAIIVMHRSAPPFGFGG